MTKGFLLIISVTFAQTAFAEFLTDGQRSDALRTLDDICGDTWCEGDFDYRFERLACTEASQTCEFGLVYIYRDYLRPDYDNPVFAVEMPQECVLSGFARAEDVVRPSRWREGRWEYSERLYDAVNDCIRAHESEALARAQVQMIEQLLAQCSSADTYWVTYNAIRPQDWSWRIAFGKAKSAAAYVAPDGELSYSYQRTFGHAFSATPECLQKGQLILWGDDTFRGANVSVTNDADEEGQVTLIGRTNALRWHDDQFEIFIFERFAN